MADPQNTADGFNGLIAVIGGLAPIIAAVAYVIRRKVMANTAHLLGRDDESDSEGIVSVQRTPTRFSDPEYESPKKKSVIAIPDVLLVEHPVFARILALKFHLNYSFTLINKGKEEVFRDMLNSKLDIWSKLLKEMCEAVDSGEIDNQTDLYNENIKVFQQALETHSSYYLNNRYSPDEQKVLCIVMDKFNKWHYRRIENTPSMIQSICDSVFYNDVKTKAAVILDTYLSEFINTIQDAQMTLNEINGDLKGLVFRNYTV